MPLTEDKTQTQLKIWSKSELLMYDQMSALQTAGCRGDTSLQKYLPDFYRELQHVLHNVLDDLLTL